MVYMKGTFPGICCDAHLNVSQGRVITLFEASSFVEVFGVSSQRIRGNAVQVDYFGHLM